MSRTKIITVSGRVQGVWFRKYTTDEATQIGLSGTVQNLENGDVLIHATGSDQQLDMLEKWCWKGSPESIVSNVTSEDSKSEEYPDFRIID